MEEFYHSVISYFNNTINNKNYMKYFNDSKIDMYGMNAFLYCCKNKMEEEALNLLNIDYNKCFLNKIINYHSVLIYVCLYKLERVAFKILDLGPLNNNIDFININGDTVLIICCKYKLENIALKILNDNLLTSKIFHVNNHGNNALFYAYKNRLGKVIRKILEYYDKNSYFHNCINNIKNIKFD